MATAFTPQNTQIVIRAKAASESDGGVYAEFLNADDEIILDVVFGDIVNTMLNIYHDEGFVPFEPFNLPTEETNYVIAICENTISIWY